MRSPWLIVALGGCYTASPPTGVPCDPATNLCPANQRCLAGPGGFTCETDDGPPVDALDDAMPVVQPCPPDPALLVCFSFDGNLASPLANEGAAPVAATLANVTRIADPTGGAALLDASSTITIPVNTVLVGVLAIEARVRLDAAIPDTMRVGVIDSDVTVPGMSMFLFGGVDTPRLRCVIGDTNLFVDAPLVLGTFIDLACTCEGGKVIAYANAIELGELDGCLPGAADTNGLQIGQNSRAGNGLPPNEPLIGAIDNVRLWTTVPQL